jgi:hypothetical protein
LDSGHSYREEYEIHLYSIIFLGFPPQYGVGGQEGPFADTRSRDQREESDCLGKYE